MLISNNSFIFDQSDENTSEKMSTTRAVQMNGGQIEGKIIAHVLIFRKKQLIHH
jgi:hypothetical protein